MWLLYMVFIQMSSILREYWFVPSIESYCDQVNCFTHIVLFLYTLWTRTKDFCLLLKNANSTILVNYCEYGVTILFFFFFFITPSYRLRLRWSLLTDML